MKKTEKFLGLILVILLALAGLSACGSKPKSDSPQSPEAVFTAAAQTAEAMRLLQPTASATIFADALAATSGALTPTPGGAADGAAQPTPQATATTVSASSLPVSSADRAEFVEDVTIPDGTIFAPNDVFVKTWKLENTGTTTWTPDYSLIFIDGDLFGSPTMVPINKQVAPGETVELSIQFTAPAEDGIYQGFWKLVNSKREVFGVGVDGIDAFWLIISVSQGAVPAATLTPTPLSGTVLTSAFLSVDNASVEGTCPHTFVFTGYFTLASPATVTYSIEASSDAGMDISLPPPTTRNLDAGTHTIFFELVFSSDVDGWARLSFSAPEKATSNQVNFSLNCK